RLQRGLDDGGRVQIAAFRRPRPDADRDVGGPHRRGIGVRRRRDDDRPDAHLFAGADDPQRDLPAIGDEYRAERRCGHGVDSGSITSNGRPYSTGSASPTRIFVTRPLTSATTGFINFIASTIPTCVSGATTSPTSTNGFAPGSGTR